MSLTLILVLAVLTYASRAAVLVILPPPPPRFAAFLDRMPAPLFASLAALALVGEDGGLVAPATLGALGGAVLAAATRSMPLILLAGMVGYGVVAVLM